MTTMFRRSRRAATPLPASRARLALEPLEERAVPATFTVTNLNDGDPGSLRQAISAANAAADADIINFTAGLTGTINLSLAGPDDSNAGGDLDILNPVSIQGPGAKVLTVKQTVANERVFDVQPATGATVAISGLTITGGNRVQAGGGVLLLTGATLTLSAVEITGNTAFEGGGVFQGVLPGSVMTIINSTIANNSAGDFGSGGGIDILRGSATITNSTISGNSAARGGGVQAGAGAVTIRNCTISGNTASFGGAGISLGGFEALTLSSTIVAGNTSPGTPGDIEGTVQAASDHNLIGNDTGLLGISNGVNGNLIGTAATPINPRLGPLQFNGGPTRTRALLPGSMAINNGSDLVGLASDQRGFPFLRVFGAGVDIGAFETQPSPQPTAQALQAAIQILQPLGARLAALAFGDVSGDFVNDIVLALRLRNNKLLIVTFDGVSGKIVGVLRPFRNAVGANARVKLVTLNLNADPMLEIGLIVTPGGPGVPRISAFAASGMRIF
jgi:Right handed beta helix region